MNKPEGCLFRIGEQRNTIFMRDGLGRSLPVDQVLLTSVTPVMCSSCGFRDNVLISTRKTISYKFIEDRNKAVEEYRISHCKKQEGN